MTIHRFAAKRDANEPDIRKRFARHGWYTEQMSGAGWPDLLCWPRFIALADSTRIQTMEAALLVDVKMPDGKVTKPQVEKWTLLRLQGIPVYVVRTEGDVDALVAGALEAWAPKTLAMVKADAGKRLSVVRAPGKGSKRAPRASYTPPRSTGAMCAPCECTREQPCGACSVPT